MTAREHELPQRIGPYDIRALLGHGSMGSVYRAVDCSGKEIALKTVTLAHKGFEAEIRREARALRNIRHPGVVRVYADGVHEGQPWYAMELIAGPSLAAVRDELWNTPASPASLSWWTASVARIDVDAPDRRASSAQQSLPPSAERQPPRVSAANGSVERVLTLGARLAGSLAYLHGEGIVHRDLKPENVVVRGGSMPVLVDFGLSVPIAGAANRERLERPGAAGTLAFMAPETLYGAPSTPQSDMYALGVLLFELLTGALPHKRADRASLADAQSALKSVDDVPEALARLVLALLDSDPRRRPTYAADVESALVALGARAADGDAPLARTYLLPTRCVGREPVLAELDRALARAADGEEGLILVGGESGVGKTRLVMEFVAQAEQRAFTVVTGQCVGATSSQPASAIGAPLEPLRPLLEFIAGHESELLNHVLEREGALLARYCPELVAHRAVIPTSEDPSITNASLRLRIARALNDLLSALAAEQAISIVIDDLQWADDLTIEFLRFFREHAETGRRALIVGAYRDDQAGEHLNGLLRAGVVPWRIERLAPAETDRVVSDMLGLTSAPPRFVAYLQRQSEGNPFFVAEYVQAALSAGVLTRTPLAGWQFPDTDALSTLLGALGLPRSLGRLLESSIAGIDENAETLLAVSSVIGNEVDLESVLAMTGLGEDTLIDALAELVGRRVLVAGGAGHYRFRHHKLREVSYDRLSPDYCRILHRTAADVLEARIKERSNDWSKLAAVAHHRECAGQSAAAIDMFERAGENAIRWGAYGDGDTLIERAIVLSTTDDHATTSAADVVRIASWHRLRADARFALGDLRGSTAQGELALGLLRRTLPATPLQWTRFLATQLPKTVCGLVWPPGRFPVSPQRQRRVAEVSRTATRLTYDYYFTDQPVLGIAGSMLAVNQAWRSREPLPVARAYAALANVICILGLPRAAARLIMQARDVACASNDDPGLACTLYSNGAIHIGLGLLERAYQLGREALEVCERARDVHEIGMVETVLAHAAHYSGRFADALEHFANVRRAAVECSGRQHEAWGEYGAARSLIPLGRLDEAQGRLKHATDLLCDSTDHASRTICAGLIARLALAQGDLHRARTLADEAAYMAAQTPPLVFSSRDAYESICEVMLAWLRDGATGASVPRDRWSGAHHALKTYRAYARRFPLGRPSYLVLRGDALAVRGRAAHALRLWKQAAACNPAIDPVACAAARERVNATTAITS